MNKSTPNEKLIGTLLINQTIAKCLSDPHRIKILDLLYHKELSTKELLVNLKKAKFSIALTTIRHHVTILKRAGLIMISKTKEVKGTLVKYYISTVKILAYDSFPLSSIYKENKDVLKILYSKFYKIIKKLLINDTSFLQNLTSQSGNVKCNICHVFHYTEYLIFLILNMIITKILRRLLKTNT